jgi:Flp pilus assembly protein TadD
MGQKVFAVSVFFVGLSPYLYLLIRSRYDPAIDWGNPETFRQFLWVLTAREFSTNMLGLKYAISGGFFKASWVYLKLLFDDISIIGLAISIAGAVFSFFVSKRFFFFFVFLYATDLAYSFAFGADLELEAYLLPSLLALVMFFGIGVAKIASLGTKRFAVLTRTAVLILPLALLILHYGGRNLKGNRYAERIGESLISTMDKGGFLFTDNTVDLFIAGYAQAINGSRPDVSLVYLPYLKYGWYREQVKESSGLDVPADKADLVSLMLAKRAYYTPLARILVPADILVPDGIRFAVASDSLTNEILAESEARLAASDFDGKTRDYDTRRHFVLIHSYLGEYYSQRGRYDLSAKEFSRASGIMPERSDVQLNLAVALERTGNLQEALAAYRKYESLGGSRLRFLKGAGRISLKQGDARAARDYLAAAASLDGNDPVVFYNLGLAHMSLGDFKAAAEADSRAVCLKPAFPEAIANLGIAYMKLGAPSLAVSQFKKAISVDSACVEAYLNLASVYLAADSLGEARSVLASGLSKASASPDLPLLKEKLAEIGGRFKSLDIK